MFLQDLYLRITLANNEAEGVLDYEVSNNV